MEAVDGPRETEPLRADVAAEESALLQEGLRVLDKEKHAVDPANPREIVTAPGARLLDHRNALILGSVAVLGSLTFFACLATLGHSRTRHLVKSRTISEEGHRGPPEYDFVGEGNCKPNRPQWASEASYARCRDTCDAAPKCIGFDWDARWTYCRVRFATNAAIASPPRGFQASKGTEGARISRQILTRGIVSGVEGSSTAGCFLKAPSVPFRELLGSPRDDGEGRALVGPLPNILDYYLETGLLGPLESSARHLQVQGMDILAFNGSGTELVLPSLDIVPLLRAMRVEELRSITLTVGINSDSRKHGLGVTIEASPQIDESKDSLPFYGHSRNRNVIKIHLDDGGGRLSIEGPGGFESVSLGFDMPGWTSSGERLHRLEISADVEGNNELLLRSATGSGTLRKRWRHRLFDGKDGPSLYAYSEWGSDPSKPLLIGRVSLKATEVWT